MPTVRVIDSVAVQHVEDGVTSMVVLRENDPYDAKDPLVKAYPWAFVADVERATAEPGEKRSARR